MDNTKPLMTAASNVHNQKYDDIVDEILSDIWSMKMPTAGPNAHKPIDNFNAFDMLPLIAKLKSFEATNKLHAWKIGVKMNMYMIIGSFMSLKIPFFAWSSFSGTP